MLTKRTVLLAATGLLIGYVAAAQPSSSAPAPDSNDFLFGLIIGLLGLVAVAVVLTGVLVTTQLKNRRQYPAETPASAISNTKERGVSPC